MFDIIMVVVVCAGIVSGVFGILASTLGVDVFGAEALGAFREKQDIGTNKMPTNHDPEGIYCRVCGHKHNPFFDCDPPWLKK